MTAVILTKKLWTMFGDFSGGVLMVISIDISMVFEWDCSLGKRTELREITMFNGKTH